jgi:molybdopterin-binding protein
LPLALSARNRLEGNAIEIQLGGVMAHVVVRVGSLVERCNHLGTSRPIRF